MKARRRFLHAGLYAAALAATGSCSDAGSRTESPAKSAAEVQSTAPNTAADGEAIYQRYCATCHAAGEGRAGTMRLRERLGADKAVLVERNDLQEDYIKAVVRRGIMLMPPFRPTEIPDGDLEALAQFLAGAERD